MSDYITENRAMVEAIKNASQKYGIAYKAFSDDWFFKLEKDGKAAFIFTYGFSCNSQASAQIASDKVATYQLLTDSSVAAVPHYLLRSVEMEDFDKELLGELIKTHQTIVVKPLNGKRGRSVAIFSTAADAAQFMDGSAVATWCASPYIEIEQEIRVVVFRGEILLAYEKHSPVQMNGLRMFNLDLGAQARALDIPELPVSTKALAIDAMKSIRLDFGAVDIVIDKGQKEWVLEINSGFSLEHFAAIDPSNRKRVVELYEQVVLASLGV